MRKTPLMISAIAAAVLWGCGGQAPQQQVDSVTVQKEQQNQGKAVVYQVFTRLFGNQNSTNKPWGTLEENGVGKFNDFTDEALEGIKELGVTHIWYTGVLHHATATDYSQYGISNDDPDVIKGRAGSPYAIKDYYNVDPDMAVDPAQRLQEFKALVERTHKHGLKVLIDIVPNHVARHYQSLNNPEGVEDFGASDDTSVTYSRNNNFYYVVGESFKVPESENGYQVLGGDQHPLADGQFDETPAKWTGNGSRAAQPKMDDWYETVRINYGVKPDGSNDFPSLPEGYESKSFAEHAAFWADKDVPDSWRKYLDIARFWISLGVDGFRYDVAELVPVEFWSFMNSNIKQINPNAFLLAEVYNPKMYRDFIHLGKMDYLYDKVDLYDGLKAIMQGKASTDILVDIREQVNDIEQHMLHFLENHDEQRIASPEFAGDAAKGMPAMVVSALINSGPTMLYFGQAVGEDGSEETGFGDPSRTTIFDYAGVPAHQRWMNAGKFDGGLLSENEKQLRDFYARLMNIAAEHPAVNGQYQQLHTANKGITQGYTDSNFAFARWQQDKGLVVVSNFSAEQSQTMELKIPAQLAQQWQSQDVKDLLKGQVYQAHQDDDGLKVKIHLEPLQSLILEFKA